MNFLRRLSIIVLAAGLCYCAGGQVSPSQDNYSQLKNMIQTDRAETKAENETLKQEIQELQNRVAKLSRTQADLKITLDEFKMMVQGLKQILDEINQQLSRERFHSTNYKTKPFSQKTTDASDMNLEQRPEHLYQTAYNDYINKKYDLAIVEFKEFLVSFPDSELADNAQYWIGECFYAQGKFSEAKVEFNRVIENYPKGEKVVPALLKIGFCSLEMGDITSGRNTLESLINKYPFSEESRLAREKLKEYN